MNIFEELKPQIEAFKVTRDNVVNGASLPPSYEGRSCGEPPFAVDDGNNYYAVINADGEASPLPFGYQVADEDIENDGVDFIFCMPMFMSGKGADTARYTPLVRDFELPNARAFCLETAEDSEAWEAVGKGLDAFQQMVNEKVLFDFNKLLSNTLVSICSSCEELESVDQAISVLLLNQTLLMGLFFCSYLRVLNALEEEMTAERSEDDE